MSNRYIPYVVRVSGEGESTSYGVSIIPEGVDPPRSVGSFHPVGSYENLLLFIFKVIDGENKRIGSLENVDDSLDQNQRKVVRIISEKHNRILSVKEKVMARMALDKEIPDLVQRL